MEVTILIPTYNRAKQLDKALSSIERQTYPMWKVSIYDDGSTDDTQKVVDLFQSIHPETKFFRSETNQGEGVARNYLLKGLDTPYFAWLDDDDESAPTRLERQLLAIGNYDACFSNSEGLMPLMGSGLYRRACALAKFSNRRLKRQDWYWLKKLILAGMTYTFINEPLYIWNNE